MPKINFALLCPHFSDDLGSLGKKNRSSFVALGLRFFLGPSETISSSKAAIREFAEREQANPNRRLARLEIHFCQVWNLYRSAEQTIHVALYARRLDGKFGKKTCRAFADRVLVALAEAALCSWTGVSGEQVLRHEPAAENSEEANWLCIVHPQEPASRIALELRYPQIAEQQIRESILLSRFPSNVAPERLGGHSEEEVQPQQGQNHQQQQEQQQQQFPQEQREQEHEQEHQPRPKREANFLRTELPRFPAQVYAQLTQMALPDQNSQTPSKEHALGNVLHSQFAERASRTNSLSLLFSRAEHLLQILLSIQRDRPLLSEVHAELPALVPYRGSALEKHLAEQMLEKNCPMSSEKHKIFSRTDNLFLILVQKNFRKN